jgi:hypothetical protein
VFGSIASGFSLTAALVYCFAEFREPYVSGYGYCLGLTDTFYDPYVYDPYGLSGVDNGGVDPVAFYLGIVSGSLGFFAFVLSTVLSCKTFPTWVLNMLGCSYIVFGYTSLLMLVGLSSAACTDNGGCTLDTGAILAIIAFFMYVGAGTSTFYLKKKLQTNQPAAPHILPEE